MGCCQDGGDSSGQAKAFEKRRAAEEVAEDKKLAKKAVVAEAYNTETKAVSDAHVEWRASIMSQNKFYTGMPDEEYEAVCKAIFG